MASHRVGRLVVVALALAAALVFGGHLRAQGGPKVRVELRSERVVFASLAQIDEDWIVVHKDGRELRFARDEVASLRMFDLSTGRYGEGESTEAEEDGFVVADFDGDAPLPGTKDQDGQDVAMDDEDSRLEGAVGPRTKPRGTDPRVSDFLDRYVWLVPTDSGHKFGVGAMLLLGLAFLVGASAKISAAPKVGFGRSVGAATTLAMFLGLGASLLPGDAVGMAVLVGGGVITFVAGQMGFFGSKLLGSMMAFLSFVLVTLVSVALIEVVGLVMQRDALMN
ncbi:MAG: hypothetical protein AAF196_20960 [Planctomycetota bacterium]